MPKRIFKITEFEGGENKIKDARDLENNECQIAKGISFDKIGRIRIAGKGVVRTPLYKHTNGNGSLHDSADIIKLSPGYGLFRFNHDYNMDDGCVGDNPQPVSSEFVAIAYRGASSNYVSFIDSNFKESEGDDEYDDTGIPGFVGEIINLGDLDYIHKIGFYYIDGGLRIFDGNFKNADTNTFYGHVKRDLWTELDTKYIINEWVKDNQSLELAQNDSNDPRPFQSEAGATGGDLGASLLFTELNSDVPAVKNKVQLQIEENISEGADGIRHRITASTASDVGQVTITTNAAHGFHSGEIVEIYGISTGNNEIYNGQYEIVGVPSTSTTFEINADGCDGSEFVESGTPYSYVSKAEDMMNPELMAKWIFGISYILDGSQETKIAIADAEADVIAGTGNQTMFDDDGYTDWTSFKTEPTLRFSFQHANTLNENSPWDKRITGFRIYMKNIEGTTAQQVSQEWHLLLDTDFIKGIYVLPGTDSTERKLNYSDNNFYNVSSATEANNAGDDIRFLSPITFESLNGYNDKETIEARYKTAVIANDRAYIGNVSQNGTSYADRIIKSPVGVHDAFPESNMIEGVVGDGDEIVKLEFFGDRLFCFKRNVLQLINISDEKEYIEESLFGYGIDHPCQSIQTNEGIAFVNKSGMYLHNGSELRSLTKDKRMPWQRIADDTNVKGFFYEGALPLLGYDLEGNKLILLRAGKASNYDITMENNSASLTNAFSPADSNNWIWDGAQTQDTPTSPAVGDIFRIANADAYDFTGGELSIAKWGYSGRAVSRYDYFRIKSNYRGQESIEYMDLDGDVFIYDLSNNCYTTRGIAFGENNSGYIRTNFVNTDMFGNNMLFLLQDTTGGSQDGNATEIVEWEDSSVIIEGQKFFQYKTKDFDFGDPAVRKKIYKIYVTFKSENGLEAYADSNIQVRYVTNQTTSDGWVNYGNYTKFSDSSTNYSDAKGLYSETNSPYTQVAELIPPSPINNVYSIQLLFSNEDTTTNDVPRGFEINDISIVYRSKNIK